MRQHHLDDNLIVFESALYRTTSTWLRAGGRQLLADPNWLPAEVDRIRAHTRACAEPMLLLFTHSDYDHIVGYGAFPGAETVASRALAEREDAAEEVRKLREWDELRYLRRDYALSYPAIDHALEGEGSRLQAGDFELLSWPAPGHTADGLISWVPERQVLIAGDYLSNEEFPFIYHSLAAYLATLDRLERILDDFPVRYCIPGHGDTAHGRDETLLRIDASRAYLLELQQAAAAGNDRTATDWPAVYGWPRGLAGEHRQNLQRLRKGEI